MTCIYLAKSVGIGTMNGVRYAFQHEVPCLPACAATIADGGKFTTAYRLSFRGLNDLSLRQRSGIGGTPGVPYVICSTTLMPVLGVRTEDGGKPMIPKIIDDTIYLFGIEFLVYNGWCCVCIRNSYVRCRRCYNHGWWRIA